MCVVSVELSDVIERSDNVSQRDVSLEADCSDIDRSIGCSPVVEASGESRRQPAIEVEFGHVQRPRSLPHDRNHIEGFWESSIWCMKHHCDCCRQIFSIKSKWLARESHMGGGSSNEGH